MDRGNPPFCWMRRPRRPRMTFARCSVVLLNIDGYSRAFAGHSAPLCTTTGPRKQASKHTHTQFDRSMVAANPHNPLYGRRRRETEEQKSQQQETVKWTTTTFKFTRSTNYLDSTFRARQQEPLGVRAYYVLLARWGSDSLQSVTVTHGPLQPTNDRTRWVCLSVHVCVH